MAPAEIAAEIEAELSAWDDLDPTATEPRSFEPQEALDVMDETSDDFEDDFVGRGRRHVRRSRRGRKKMNGEAAVAAAVADAGETERGREAAEPRFAEPARGAAGRRGHDAPADEFGEGLDFEPAEFDGAPDSSEADEDEAVER